MVNKMASGELRIQWKRLGKDRCCGNPFGGSQFLTGRSLRCVWRGSWDNMKIDEERQKKVPSLETRRNSTKYTITWKNFIVL